MARVHEAAAIQELRRLIPRCLLPDQIRLGHALLRANARCAAASPLPVARLLAEARASIRTRERRAAILQGIAYPAELPITARKDEIVAALRAHRVVVVAGETGSGKTTQLPKMCLEAGLGLRARIGCTQPRRVAALAISRRLAEELGVTWGREVGCKIRFADVTRPESALKVMTDGILLAELQGDPLLAEYEALIIDEAHERSLNIDFLLGYLKQLLARRDDLKLVITSATIDTALFARAFGGAPVIEVSGRLYPVETRYSPLDEHAEEEGEVTYIDATVSVVGRLLEESPAGDVLVFMPGERDIHETCDLLEARHGARLDVVPLFGRLAAGDQQRVFAPGPRRRVVVATNIAETSLTVPRIRYVVDTGLARLSRYSPGTRTHRLPVEPVSQSSANQRAGRCGRVADGVCVRLYREDDFHARRPFTEPEIQRCDLAEVILRMKAWQLGEVETFPFLEPPTPAAVNTAYQLLQEIGALDDQRALTPLGRDLARLPVDPAIGRMLLQARAEDALPEVLVIAAGLSIQDPRERPLAQKDAAQAAHRRFQDPRSDFLTLLNIWSAYHDPWEALKTQNLMRQFCKAHFLSFARMREWRDVHAELEEAVAELGELRPASAPASDSPNTAGQPPASDFPPRYAAIHRSILTGLWGHVLHREDRNLYRAAGGRLVMVFPGSGLFARGATATTARTGRASLPDQPPPKVAQPEWLVAGEIVETTRPYARTVAAIDPAWIIELAPHLIRTTHDQARWDPAAGRVLARERMLLRGLVLRERAVGYGAVNPAEATAIFIRAALVEDGASETNAGTEATQAALHAGGARPRRALTSSSAHNTGRGEASAVSRPPARARERLAPPARARRFLEHNRRLREKIELWQTRLSHRVVPDLDKALVEFYTARLSQVSSWPDLDRALKAAPPDFLCGTAADLLGGHAAAFNAEAFPDELTLAGHPVPVAYAYAPGREHDGVTLQLAVPLAELVDAAQLDWLVPALREERIAHLLRELPKALRRPLMPLNAAAREIAALVPAAGGDFLAALSSFVQRRYGVQIPVSAWPLDRLPEHLRPRVELVAGDGRLLAAGRDLAALREQARQHRTPAETDAWQQATRRWERYGLREWNFGDLPETITVADFGGVPLRAWPGLHLEDGAVHLRLFREAAEALAATRAAVPRLAEIVLQRELAAVQKDLRSLRAHGVLYATLGAADELLDSAWENLRRHLLPAPDPAPRTAAAFKAYLERVRAGMPGLVSRLAAAVGAILQARQEVLLCRRPFAGMEVELNALVPARFLAHVPFERLPHLPRYLQALRVRAERAALNPAKDAAKVVRVRPYAGALRQLAAGAKSVAARAAWHRLRWLIEEFKVSVFAPELGTAEKVSPHRLDEVLTELRQAVE
jgi:ATP-dependent helicase HrpA